MSSGIPLGRLVSFRSASILVAAIGDLSTLSVFRETVVMMSFPLSTDIIGSRLFPIVSALSDQSISFGGTMRDFLLVSIRVNTQFIES